MKNFCSTFPGGVQMFFSLLIVLSAEIQTVAQTTRQKNTSAIPKQTPLYNTRDAGTFMRSWWLAGPVSIGSDTLSDRSEGRAAPVTNDAQPDLDAQEAAFRSLLPGQTHFNIGKSVSPLLIAGKKLNWFSYTSANDLIDLDAALGKIDYVKGYALAEINADSAATSFFAVGSDDAIKVWLNGKLIHTNWTARGVLMDNDVVALDLKKGRNQVLVEVQDIMGGWSFMARLLDRDALADKLVQAAASGNLDDIALFLKARAHTGKRTAGKTALDAARINGRQEAAKQLLDQGAKDLDVPQFEQLVAGLYDSLNHQQAPGISLLVSKDGKVIYHHAFGFANIKSGEPVTPSTKFRIGSITKQFVAAAILKLQEEGRISVTDKLSRFFPDFPRGDEVSIHHLLTHTSGIASYTNKDSFVLKVLHPISNEQLLNEFIGLPYDFDPGERYSYNNSGYFLLGYIIEKITGKPFGNYLEKAFFEPLQMANTGVHKNEPGLDQEAIGYQHTDTGFVPALDWSMSWAAGAGALYSTTEDLFKWNEALFSGKLLSKASLDSALTPVLLNNGKTPDGVQYGYGLSMEEFRGRKIIAHSGGLHGFVSQLIRIPEDRLTIVMLTNVTPPQVEMNPNKLAELYLWKNLPPQPSYSVQPLTSESLKVYEGRYDVGNLGILIITAAGNELYSQMSGQQKARIYPGSPDAFFWKIVEAKINFNRNASNDVISADLEQGSFRVTAPKLEKPVFDFTIYSDYVGEFRFDEKMVLHITTSDNKLFVQPVKADGSKDKLHELIALSAHEFIQLEENARIVFSHDDSRKVNTLKISVGGQIKNCPRVK